MPITESGLYVAEDISFINIEEVIKTRRYFERYGTYTLAPEGSKDYIDFWDIEEERRTNGMTIPGRLVDGKIQEVHFTGEHYSYLNFGQILASVDNEDEELMQVIKTTAQQRKSGKKQKVFPDFWDGDYHWFVAKETARRLGLHICCGKARRKGFSYKEAFDCANTVNLQPYCTVIIGAFDTKYLFRGDGTMTMAKNYLDFFELNTDFARGYLKTAKDEVELGYMLEGTKIPKGYRSKILAVSFGPDNPDAAIGKDAVKIKIDESGRFPNLLDMLEVTLPTLEDGDIITGQMALFGTGGTKDSNWEGFESVFYNPELYGFMSFDNVWDEGTNGTACGFFFPHFQNLKPYIDKNGNSDILKAKEESNIKRLAKKKVSRSNSDYARYIGQRAFSPSEAFSRSSDNIFPGIDLAEQAQRIERDKYIKHLARTGNLVYTAEGLKFVESDLHPPVPYPRKKDTDVHGCITEWQPPYKSNGKVPKGLYRIWHDPYATDKDKDKITVANSLGAAYVYEKTNNFTSTRGNRIVASLIGRPESSDDYNTQLLRLCEYYNAGMMFENDRGDVKPFFKKARALEYLAEEPEMLWKKELASKTGRNYGMHMTDKRIAQGCLYLRDWLLEKQGTDSYTGKPMLNLHYIFDLSLINELLKWNLKGNFDRVSALLIGMFDMKETENREIEVVKTEKANDFFNRQLFK